MFKDTRFSPTRLAHHSSLLLATLILTIGFSVLFYYQKPLKELINSAQPDVISVTYLRLLLNIYPQDATLRLALAHQLRNLGRLQEANDSLEPLLTRQDAKAVQAQLLSLEIRLTQFYSLSAADPQRQARLASLERWLERLAEDPLPIADLVRVAKVSLEVGRPELAARLYVQLADTDLANRSSWLATAGQCYLAAGQPDKAYPLYHQASVTTQDVKQSHSYALLALNTALAANQGATGLQLARDYLKRFSDDRELLDKVIGMALAQNDTHQALQWGFQRLALDPEEPKQVTRQLDLALAAGDLPGAVALAQRYVTLQPEENTPRERLAHIAEWAGQPQLALQQWAWLAHRNLGGPFLQTALNLARGLQNDPVRIELLTLRSNIQSLSKAELSELVDVYNRSGKPIKAIAFLKVYLQRHPLESNGWELLASLQEQSKNLQAAAATWQYIGTHFGDPITAACHQAELLWRLSQRNQSFSVLQRLQSQVPADHVRYWKLFGDQAWNLKQSAEALRTYRTLWKAGQTDQLTAERLIVLARDAGYNDEAVTTAEAAFQRSAQPRLLLLGMDVAFRAKRWNALAHLVKIAQQKEELFQASEMYWVLKGQLAAHNGKLDEARANQEKILQLNPNSVPAQVNLLWLLIQNNDKVRLSQYIARWRKDALANSSFWNTYAAALMKLGRAQEALPWFERYAHTNPRDYPTLLSYADALTQVGQTDAAWRLRQHTLLQLRAGTKQGDLKDRD